MADRQTTRRRGAHGTTHRSGRRHLQLVDLDAKPSTERKPLLLIKRSTITEAQVAADMAEHHLEAAMRLGADHRYAPELVERAQQWLGLARHLLPE